MSDHPLYPYALTYGAVYTASVGHDLLVAATSLRDEAFAATERLGADPPLIEQRIATLNSYALIARGAHQEAATWMERSGTIAQSAGRLGAAAFQLGAAAFEYMMAGDTVAARRVATDGLALAREVRVPSAISSNLNALAGALVDEDREQAEALFWEAVQVRSSFGYETATDNSGRRAECSSPAMDRDPRLRCQGDPPLPLGQRVAQPGALCNLVARAVAATHPEPAAVLQGIAYRFATSGAPPRSQPASRGTNPQATETRQRATPTDTVGLITQLRRVTTAMLVETLGDARLRELRNEGQTMDTDTAVAYTLSRLDLFLTNADD